jgi:hypothetical protein
MEKESFQKHIFDTLTALSGPKQQLTLPILYLEFTNGDHLASLFLSQLLYWTDKSKDKEGWIYKSYNEWYKELWLSKYQVASIVIRINNLYPDRNNENIIETKLKKANGAPTIHYKINSKALIDRFVKFLDNRKLRNLTIDSEETSQSLTYNTSKTTSENTDINGFQKKTSENDSISLKDFCKKYYEDTEKKKAILYYGNLYKSKIGSSHKKLPLPVWRKIENDLFRCDEIDKDLTPEYVSDMINRHFSKDYKQKIDYCILHFNTPGIKKILFYEACY